MISLDIKNPKPKGDSYCGKLKCRNKKHHDFSIFDDGCNPKKGKKTEWRRTLADFQFRDQKFEKFGKIMTAKCFFVPIEGAFSPGGKYYDNIQVETSEVIRLLPNCVFLEDEKPSFDKDKNKYTMNFQHRAGAKSTKNSTLMIARPPTVYPGQGKQLFNNV